MRNEFHILLVDDSPTDVKIIERILKESGVQHRLTVMHDGRHALDFMKTVRDSETYDQDVPDLVLLDLNLPGIDGGQVLVQIKTDPYLKSIPVVVLTTSRREDDVAQMYAKGANTFIEKPSEYPRYCDLVSTLELYWREVAVPPPRKRPKI